MNNTPSKFELILEEETARKYMVKRFSRRNLWIEVSGPSDAFTALIGKDMMHFNELRALIRNALTDENGSAREKAEYWSSFLKPRIETLEYQSVLRARFAAYSAAAMAFIALMLNAFELPVGAGIAAAVGALAGMYLSLRRLEIDRRRAWYKYVVAHLDAIKGNA